MTDKTTPPLGTERDHYPDLLTRVKSAFPEFNDRGVRYAANKITNEIRRSRQDCYAVDVARSPVQGAGYHRHFEIKVSGQTVFVRVTVD